MEYPRRKERTMRNFRLNAFLLIKARYLLLISFILLSITVFGRIGECLETIRDRYGSPVDSQKSGDRSFFKEFHHEPTDMVIGATFFTYVDEELEKDLCITIGYVKKKGSLSPSEVKKIKEINLEFEDQYWINFDLVEKAIEAQRKGDKTRYRKLLEMSNKVDVWYTNDGRMIAFAPLLFGEYGSMIIIIYREWMGIFGEYTDILEGL